MATRLTQGLDQAHEASASHGPAGRPSRQLLVLEIGTVVVLVGLALVFARPELEGWAILDDFRIHGGWVAYGHAVDATPLRPLEPFPYLLSWFLGHGQTWAVGLTYGGILAARFVAARWAVSTVLQGTTRWVVATLAAVMLPWTEQWHSHTSALQLAAVFLVIALGAALRLRDQFRVRWFLVGTAAALLSFLTYEALFLCALAIPVVLLLGTRVTLRESIRPALRAATPVVGAAVLYGLYAIWTRSETDTFGYQSYLLSGEVKPIDSPGRLLTYLYRTTYLNDPWTVVLLIAFVLCLVGPQVMARPERRERTRAIIAFAVALIGLPLFALLYAVNFYYLSDPERLGLPLSFAFLLLCITALIRFPTHQPPRIGLVSFVLVSALLVGATFNAYDSHRPYVLQRAVLDQTEALVRVTKARAILVRDWTGTLGDMFTFLYPETLQSAMSVEGVEVAVDLCTPTVVDRIHPKLQSVHGTSPVLRCESLPPGPTDRLVLDIRYGPDGVDGGPVVTRAA